MFADTVSTTVAAGAFPLELGWMTHLKVLDLRGQPNMSLWTVSCLMFTPKSSGYIAQRSIHMFLVYIRVCPCVEAVICGVGSVRGAHEGACVYVCGDKEPSVL